MPFVYDIKNDTNDCAKSTKRKSCLDCNGILVTSEDLNVSLETPPSIGSKTIYIKPLPSEYDMLSSSLVNEKRFPKPEKSALLPFTSSSDDLIPLTSAAFSPTSVHNIKTSKDNDTNNSNLEVIPSSYPSSYSPTEVNYDHVTDKRDYNTSHTITPPQSITSNHEDQNSQRPHKQRRYPHHRHVNRNSFNRHSTLRRSLGGVTILSYANTSHKYSSDSDVSQKIDVSSEKTNGREVIVIKNDAKLTDYLSSPSRTSESINNSSDTVNYQRYVFRISDLPAWEDLGFLLKPFSSNRKIKPKFKGFRLANKSACTRQFPHLYYNGYNNIPFRSGDIIVSVNHHKLSNVSEAEALQYVYNAFTDAERQHTIEIGILRPSLSGNRSSRNSCIPTEPSTLPRNLMIRQKSDSGYSNSIEMTISPSNPHQPRRRTNHSSPEISPELLSLNTKGGGENNNRIMRNTKLSNLHRLSLMDYPDSPHLSTSSPRILSIDKFTTTPTTGGDANSYGGIGYRNSINTATLALSLSSNLTENGFITIRRPKHPTSLATVDSGRHSISSATESHSSLSRIKKSSKVISPKITISDAVEGISSTAGTGENSGSNLSNSRTLTPHMEEVKSPCISRSLNVSKKDPNAFNTRTIGQTMHIQLTKTRTNGLGFTLTSRDTQTQSSQISDPVYVKKILPDGAAIQDGRLMIGDRLLAIDGENVQSLNHVLSKLRSLEPGKQVDLLISRHASCNDADVNVRKALMPSRPFVTLTYEYYLPLDTSQSDSSRPPALGINFKWSNDILLSSSSSAEMSKITVDNELTPTPSSQYSPVPGLYIDSLLPGCLVTSDNRITLQPGDRLVGINGESVAGMNIKNIIKRLKSVLKHCHEQNVHNAGQSSTSFSLTVHRYKDEENTQSSTGESVRPSDLPPRRIKSLQLEELENSHQTHNQHHRDKSNNLSGQTNSQENCSLSFTLSDNRRRLLHRSDSLSCEIESRSLHHRGQHSYRTGQRSNGDSDHQIPLPLSSTASSPIVQYPSPRNLSVPSNRNFLREGFGRRSVSEKRHGHVDASQFSFFQTNILPNRYKMPEDVDKQYSTMPTTRRLKMHKARLAAGAATNSQLPISVVGGGGQGLGGIAGSGSGPLKALHPSNGMPPQSPVNTSHQDPEEVDIELQLDQMPLSRNRKQNNSFRHAVDRSLFPTTTDNNISSNNYANTLNMKSLPKTCFESPDVNSSPPPPVPPHHPRSETSSHGKLGIGGCHKSSKAKIFSPLSQPSSHSSSVSNTNHPERPRSKSRSEINSQTTLLFQDKSLHSSSNSTHLTTEQKQNKSGLTTLKNIFRIGNSKTVSDLNDPMLKNVSYSETSESSTLLSKKQIRRLSVPEYQISTNHLTPSTLITDIQNDNLLLAKKTPSNHSSGQYRSSKAAHINSHSMRNNDSSLSKVLSPCMLNSRNTVRVNPYCPPPDINPPPLPPRVGYSTPSVISPQSHHSKPIKYRPLPEPPKTSCTATATTITTTSIPKQSMQKKSSYSIPMSVTSPPSSICINQISNTVNHQSSPLHQSSKVTSIVPTSLIQTTQPTLPANSKKSNSCHDNQKHHHRQCGYVISPPDTTRHHRHREGQYSSNQNAVHPDCCVESQTPAVYINSRHASKQPKKTAPSPHRSRSTHSHSSSNNNSVTAPNSILFYQAPLPSSHSSVSSSRRHRLQEHVKSDGHSKNRLLVTMPEASLITSQPVDKLITPRRSKQHH